MLRLLLLLQLLPLPLPLLLPRFALLARGLTRTLQVWIGMHRYHILPPLLEPQSAHTVSQILPISQTQRIYLQGHNVKHLTPVLRRVKLLQHSLAEDDESFLGPDPGELNMQDAPRTAVFLQWTALPHLNGDLEAIF